MTKEDYRANMDALVVALNTFVSLTEHITDEELYVMGRTLELADSVSFLMVMPLALSNMNDNLKAQKEVIRLLREVRVFREKVRELQGD